MIRSMHQTLNTIARNVLDVPTLECRNSDSLDFYELSVWQFREALEKAYRAGIHDGGRP